MGNLNDIYALGDMIELSKELKNLIDQDMGSIEKINMRKADSYYDNVNDIANIDFRKYKGSCGETKINENRSNQRLSHNFLKILVNQAVSYIVGNPVNYSTDDKQFQDFLDDYLMFNFDDMVVNLCKEVRKKGRGYIHVYYDSLGELDYAVIPSEQIIPIYRDGFKKELESVIRYYGVNALDSKGKEVVAKRVEWWTENEVRYFNQNDEGGFDLDIVSPQWEYSIDTNPDLVEGLGWGKVPFVEVFNNDEGTGDLVDIKCHVDSYDLIQSEFVNQIADIREILIKVLGYSGSSADDILQAFRGTGIVKIDDASGNVDVLKSEIPVEARQSALTNLRDNIFLFGQGVDPAPDKIGTTVSGIALKMLYGSLDLKCNISIRLLKKGLYQFIWFLAEHFNRTHGGGANYKHVKFTVNKNMIVNETEIITNLANSKGLISDSTILENHPFVLDVELEEERLAAQNENDMEDFYKAIKTEEVEKEGEVQG